MTESSTNSDTVWKTSHETGKKHDPLLECLVALSRIHGISRTRDALISGLPLVDHTLTPSIFDRAARRAGMASKVMRRTLDEFPEPLLPVILLLNERDACLLVGWETDGSARVVFPESSESAEVLSRERLASRYTGLAIFCRPRFRFDKRAPEQQDLRGRHWFWHAIMQNLPVYKDILLAALLINLFAVALPMFTMNVYDRVVPNQATDTLWVLATGLLIIMMADIGLRLMRGYLIDLAGSRVDVGLSAQIMERVLGLRMENRPLSTGAFAANLRSFETVRDFITSATVTAVIDLPFALLFLVVIAWIDLPLVIPGLVGMVLIIGYAMLVQDRMHELSETTYRASAQRNAHLVESLVGLETVKAQGAENIMQRKWEQSATFLARISTQLRLLSATTVNSAFQISQLAYMAVIVLGVYRIGDGALSMGGLIASSMLISRAMAPFSQVAGLLTQYHSASTALTSLNKIMDSEIERPSNASFVSRPDFQGDIEFHGVSFTYPGEEAEALRNISFRIKPGEHVAILGRIGSGKTTLQKLILGLYKPTAGSIRIDGIDIRQLDPAELRRNIGYVPQDVTLFFGGLRENIAMSSPEADDSALLAAAEVGGLLDMVNSHPRGFDMIIGERGESLSGGQRQSVAIARAFVNSPPILLLDEPTGSMDFSTEESVKSRLREHAKDRTMIVITHRTSLLDLVDRLIVIDRGKIVADGPKANVIEALKQGRIESAK
ncbi:Toxin secretion ABC transporter permease and ATP-binding protein [Sterolibacterium denitrificans]|uniref:Cyclolysin secretion/processing ATP-binding protein CyaB n=1 Tax=Sterolibacterium denitrificans TaxID=157592 RepID=A0A7Z7MU49_9PROT|nr:type I secretion system permease/ATPase [Sterolibacterium denitrificans]SMB21235.1 Toxin secretion ABC transporter permease and ATP-binding protein [Sterolibacterium denitrificans]